MTIDTLFCQTCNLIIETKAIVKAGQMICDCQLPGVFFPELVLCDGVFQTSQDTVYYRADHQINPLCSGTFSSLSLFDAK
jgi:hypothetical protein